MRQRFLGQTGLAISEIGFGCGTTAELMISGDRKQRAHVVGAALDAGITYFDTAAQYGDGASETNLGITLRDLGASPVVATKVTLGLDDLPDIGARVERSVEASLKRLGRDHVDIVHLHNRVGRERAARPNIGSGTLLDIDDVLGPRGVAEAFHRLRQRGLIGHAGCCAFGGEPEAIGAVMDSGVFASALVNYSMLNPTAWHPVSAGFAAPDYDGIGTRAAGSGTGAIALRVLEAGALTGRDTAIDEADGKRRHLHRLAFLLDDHESFAEAAVRFALSNAAVSTVLVGISDAAQLSASIAAAGRGPLPPATLARIAAVWSEAAQA